MFCKFIFCCYKLHSLNSTCFRACIAHHLMNKKECFFCKATIQSVVDTTSGLPIGLPSLAWVSSLSFCQCLFLFLCLWLGLCLCLSFSLSLSLSPSHYLSLHLFLTLKIFPNLSNSLFLSLLSSVYLSLIFSIPVSHLFVNTVHVSWIEKARLSQSE